MDTSNVYLDNFKKEYQTCPVLAYTTIAAILAVLMNAVLVVRQQGSVMMLVQNVLTSLLVVALFYYLCKNGHETIGYVLLGVGAIALALMYSMVASNKCIKTCADNCVEKCFPKDPNDDE